MDIGDDAGDDDAGDGITVKFMRKLIDEQSESLNTAVDVLVLHMIFYKCDLPGVIFMILHSFWSPTMMIAFAVYCATLFGDTVSGRHMLEYCQARETCSFRTVFKEYCDPSMQGKRWLENLHDNVFKNSHLLPPCKIVRLFDETKSAETGRDEYIELSADAARRYCEQNYSSFPSSPLVDHRFFWMLLRDFMKVMKENPPRDFELFCPKILRINYLTAGAGHFERFISCGMGSQKYDRTMQILLDGPLQSSHNDRSSFEQCVKLLTKIDGIGRYSAAHTMRAFLILSGHTVPGKEFLWMSKATVEQQYEDVIKAGMHNMDDVNTVLQELGRKPIDAGEFAFMICMRGKTKRVGPRKSDVEAIISRVQQLRSSDAKPDASANWPDGLPDTKPDADAKPAQHRRKSTPRRFQSTVSMGPSVALTKANQASATVDAKPAAVPMSVDNTDADDDDNTLGFAAAEQSDTQRPAGMSKSQWRRKKRNAARAKKIAKAAEAADEVTALADEVTALKSGVRFNCVYKTAGAISGKDIALADDIYAQTPEFVLDGEVFTWEQATVGGVEVSKPHKEAGMFTLMRNDVPIGVAQAIYVEGGKSVGDLVLVENFAIMPAMNGRGAATIFNEEILVSLKENFAGLGKVTAVTRPMNTNRYAVEKAGYVHKKKPGQILKACADATGFGYDDKDEDKKFEADIWIAELE